MPGLGLPPFLLPQAVAITFTTGIFLGFYLISVAFANRWLIIADEGWKLRKSIHWCTLAATNIIAVLVLLDEGVNISTPIEESGFVERGHKLEDYAEPPWRTIMRCILFDVISLLADTVLMYRLWITYLKRASVMWFPFILWLGGIACVGMQTFLQIKNIHDPNFGPYRWSKVNMNVGPGIVVTPFLASTIVLNAYCTGLLMWRIWKTLRRCDSRNRCAPRRLQFLIRILMESGVLYLSTSIAHFFVYFGHDPFAIHMIGTLNTIVIGIAHNLIIIRVGMNRSEEDERGPDDQMLSTLVFSCCQAEGISTSSTTDPGLEVKECV